jgi:hypothetical protein
MQNLRQLRGLTLAPTESDWKIIFLLCTFCVVGVISSAAQTLTTLANFDPTTDSLWIGTDNVPTRPGRRGRQPL